jgi:hypothetical protein
VRDATHARHEELPKTRTADSKTYAEISPDLLYGRRISFFRKRTKEMRSFFPRALSTKYVEKIEKEKAETSRA